MKRYIKLTLAILIGIILLLNLVYQSEQPVYQFKTAGNEYNALVMSATGHTYDKMLESFESFKKSKPEYANLELCRTFERDFKKVWQWGDYLFNPVWKHPYCELY